MIPHSSMGSDSYVPSVSNIGLGPLKSLPLDEKKKEANDGRVGA